MHFENFAFIEKDKSAFSEFYQYCKDRLKNSAFLSLLVCTKQSILFGQGNSTQTVFKGTPS